MSSEHVKPSETVHHLESLLRNLYHNPYPLVPNPPGCKKRASVALVVRIHPSYSSWPTDENNKATSFNEREDNSTDEGPLHRLRQFFSQPWVQQGEPEVLFIKRAARPGDRWNSHVALPGGKRDPGDENDRAVAVRETWEEVGLDLNNDRSLFIGNLPEIVVTTSWGKVP